MKWLFLLLLPVLIFSEDLKELLKDIKSNNLIKAKMYEVKAKKKEFESIKASKFPTLDVGGVYQSVDKANIFMPKRVTNSYAKLSYELYDGGYKSLLANGALRDKKALWYQKRYFTKSLMLEVVRDYFTIQNMRAKIKALHDKKRSLKAQLERVKKFIKADLASNDDFYKLKSAYETNIYQIKELEYQKQMLKKILEIKIGKKISSLDDSYFEKKQVSLKEDDEIKSIKESISSLGFNKKAINSAYKPHLRVEDSYSRFDYGGVDSLHPVGVNNQNKITLSANWRIFDNQSVKKKKLSLLFKQKALNEQLEYKIKLKKVHFEMAKKRLKVDMQNLQSVKSAFKSAKSSYNLTKKKYEAGLSDIESYFDSLSKLSFAKSLYATAKNQLQIDLGAYYFYSGRDIREFIR